MIKKHFDNSILQFYRIKNKFIRFIFVGALNTAFSFTIYSILVFIGVSYYIAVLIASVLGILFNYKTTGKLVFEHHSNKLLLKFFAVYIVTYFLNIGSLRLLFNVGVDKYTGALIVALPLAVISFLLNKMFVFNTKMEAI